MRLCYVLLSPTFGMHQYTADLANRMAGAGHDVHLVTTERFPRDRYGPGVTIHTPARTTNTGLSSQSLRAGHFAQIEAVIAGLGPDVVHFSGPHLWNAVLVQRLRERGIPVVHTLHDLDPHHGTRLGFLLVLWNRLIVRRSSVVLVHGEQYYARLLAGGMPAERLALTPLLHLFLSHEQVKTLGDLELDEATGRLAVTYEPFALFFGRLEKYKGINYLLTAFAELHDRVSGNGAPSFSLVVAGPGKLPALWTGNLPPQVELRNRLVGDDEALDLFRRCSLVVLPYVDATQSALVAAAYFFHKPVLVTYAGALAEYVEPDVTGFVAEPDHPPSLARQLRRAFDNRARLQQMGSAGRAWYDGRRAQELAALLGLYEQVAGREWVGVRD